MWYENGVQIDVRHLKDSERNFLCTIVCEMMSFLNETDPQISFRKLGLILRAAVSQHVFYEYVRHAAEKIKQCGPGHLAWLEESRPPWTWSWGGRVAADPDGREPLGFMPASPIEGPVTVQQLHSSWINITPYIAQFDLEQYAELDEGNVEVSKYIFRTLHEHQNTKDTDTGFDATFVTFDELVPDHAAGALDLFHEKVM